MNLEYLKRLDEQYRNHQEKSEELRLERNDAIRQLVDQGVRMSTIAKAIGVTRARIAQIYDQPT